MVIPRHHVNSKQFAPVPDIRGPVPGMCLCIVIATHSTDAPPGYPEFVNYASAITYDVLVDTPNGPMRFNNVKPGTPRWQGMLVQGFSPTSDAETGEPAQVLPGGISNGRFYLLCSELPYAAECQSGGG